MVSACYLGIDIGNTNQTIATADATGELLRVERRRTRRESGAEGILCEVLGAVALLTRDQGPPLRRIGVGFGGPVDMPTGTVRCSHLLPGWEGLPLRDLLQERFGVPAVVDNDANAATLGELLFGAGRGVSDLVYINIGTGIGGGVVIGGKLHRGVSTSAGEVGHMTVLPGGPLCSCGRRGCLEALCAGPSIGRRARELAAAEPRLGARLLALASGELSHITGEIAFQAAREGDAGGCRVLADTVEHLAIAIGTLVNILNPQAVILGGGVAEVGELLIRPLSERVRASCLDAAYQATRIVPAAIGYDAGVRGAVALAMQEET